MSITAVSAGKDYLALGSADGECIIQPLKNLKVSRFLYANYPIEINVNSYSVSFGRRSYTPSTLVSVHGVP